MVTQMIDYAPLSTGAEKGTTSSVRATVRNYSDHADRFRAHAGLARPSAYLTVRHVTDSQPSQANYEVESELPQTSAHVRHLRTIWMATDEMDLFTLVTNYRHCLEPLARSLSFLSELPLVEQVEINLDTTPGFPPIRLEVGISDEDGAGTWERVRATFFEFVETNLGNFPPELVLLPRFV